MRRSLFISVALVAFAAVAAIPAIASASPVLQNTAGGTVAVNSGLTGFSSNLVFHTAAGNLECSESDLIGKVSENTGTKVAGTIESATFKGPETVTGVTTTACHTTISGNPKAVITGENLNWCLATVGAAMEWELKACAAGAAVKFAAKLYTGAGSLITECKYSTTAGRLKVTGTYNTPTTPAVYRQTVGAGNTFEKTAGSILCSATGELVSGGEFALKSVGGTVEETMVN